MASIKKLGELFSHGYDSGDITKGLSDPLIAQELKDSGGDYARIFKDLILPSINRAANILEIGPGKGSWTHAALSNTQESHVHAVDILELKDILFDRCAAFRNRLNFHRIVNFDYSCFPDDFFDFAFSMGVFVHMDLKDMYSVLNGIRPKMKSSAKIVIHYSNWDKLDQYGWEKGRVPVRFKTNPTNYDTWWTRNNYEIMSAVVNASGWCIETMDTGHMKRDSICILRPMYHSRPMAVKSVINWGDFGQLIPIDDCYGNSRGRPIDRFYIEGFLEQNSADIKGTCLEILDDNMTRRFGGDRVDRSDVLDIDADNRRANVVTDLQNASCVPDNTYDCFIMTQTVHVIPDFTACIREAYRMLKPGGILLATVPCISRCDVAATFESDYWRMTPAGAKETFGKVFGPDNISVRGYGNVKVGLAFWTGLGQADLSADDFNHYDANFPVLVSIRAVKPDLIQSNEVKTASTTRTRMPRPDEKVAIVLVYHRIRELDKDPFRLAISPTLFEEHLSYLSRRYNLLSASDFAKCFENRSWPDKPSILISFDDGYRDNLDFAAPILNKFGIPSLHFISSGYLSKQREFWWDEMERSLLNDTTPATISLTGETLATTTMPQKLDTLMRIHRIALAMDAAKRKDLLEQIRKWAMVDTSPRSSHKTLSESELCNLAAYKYVTIGGHTSHHFRLTSETPAIQRQEILEDKRRLESILGRELEFFSYPFGNATAQDATTKEIVRESGYRMAFINNAQPILGMDIEALSVSRACIGQFDMQKLRTFVTNMLTSNPTNITGKTSLQCDVFPRDDGKIMQTLRELVKSRWSLFGYKDSLQRVALYGAGKHSEWLLGLVRGMIPNVVCIIDDNPNGKTNIGGVPVVIPSQAKVKDFEAIVLSTDTFLDQFRQRVRELWPEEKSLSLYDGLWSGPYPK